MKCKVLPPKKLFLPVLPHRCKDKLMFPLCSQCATSLNQGVYDHEDDARCLIGTWVTEELKLALDKGYKIIKVRFYFLIL